MGANDQKGLDNTVKLSCNFSNAIFGYVSEYWYVYIMKNYSYSCHMPTNMDHHFFFFGTNMDHYSCWVK